MSKNTENVLVALLAGVAVGASLGILFAPDKGSKTRDKIKGSYDDTKDNLLDKFNDLSKEVKKKLSSSKHDLEKMYEDLIAGTTDKNGDVIAFLENKLQDLKSQNNKIKN